MLMAKLSNEPLPLRLLNIGGWWPNSLKAQTNQFSLYFILTNTDA